MKINKIIYDTFSKLLDKIYSAVQVISDAEDPLNAVNIQTPLLIQSVESASNNLAQAMTPVEVIESFKYAIVTMYDRLIFDSLGEENTQECASIETAIFRTSISGDKFFENIRKIQLYTGEYKKTLLFIYLKVALCAFNKSNTQADLVSIRTELFQNVFDSSPTSDATIFKLNVEPATFMPKAQFSRRIAPVLVIVYLIINSGLWIANISSVESSLGELQHSIKKELA